MRTSMSARPARYERRLAGPATAAARASDKVAFCSVRLLSTSPGVARRLVPSAEQAVVTGSAQDQPGGPRADGALAAGLPTATASQREFQYLDVTLLAPCALAASRRSPDASGQLLEAEGTLAVTSRGARHRPGRERRAGDGRDDLSGTLSWTVTVRERRWWRSRLPGPPAHDHVRPERPPSDDGYERIARRQDLAGLRDRFGAGARRRGVRQHRGIIYAPARAVTREGPPHVHRHVRPWPGSARRPRGRR